MYKNDLKMPTKNLLNNTSWPAMNEKERRLIKHYNCLPGHQSSYRKFGEKFENRINIIPLNYDL